jgi:hypothetical protein
VRAVSLFNVIYAPPHAVEFQQLQLRGRLLSQVYQRHESCTGGGRFCGHQAEQRREKGVRDERELGDAFWGAGEALNQLRRMLLYLETRNTGESLERSGGAPWGDRLQCIHYEVT